MTVRGPSVTRTLPDKGPSILSGQELITEIARLGQSLDALDDSIARIDPMIPWQALAELEDVQKELKRLRPSYEAGLRGLSFEVVGREVSGHGLAVVVSQQSANMASLVNLLFVQQRWHDVDTASDRKQVWSLGILSLYLAIISVLIAVLPVGCHYLPSLPDAP